MTCVKAQWLRGWNLRRMKTWIEIDARGLEPPEPMVRILETLATLPADTGILARTDRKPVFLLDDLPRRGFAGESAPDGKSYATRIQRL